MALKLNVFQTVTEVVGTSPVGIYTAPVGYTGVVLLAQCANIGSNSYRIIFSSKRKCWICCDYRDIERFCDTRK